MLHQLKDFFKQYPENLLSLCGKRPQDIDPGLLHSLNDYQNRQQIILEDTHAFRFDVEAELMLTQLINEIERDGLEDTYQSAVLPFPAITLEKQTDESGASVVGLLTQVDGNIYTQVFMINEEGVAPSMFALKSNGLDGEFIPTPSQEFFRQQSVNPRLQETINDERTWAQYFLGLSVAIFAMLRHQSMLDVEEVAAYPRAERRRAKKSGTKLPDFRVSKIKLGVAGRGQWEAMQEDAEKGNGDRKRRRTHWVRGHYMRNPSGGLSWRMPHLRGAGPLIRQERHIVAENDEGSGV